MTEENKKHNIAQDLKRADDALAAARALDREGLYVDAVGRAYYHAFYCARALLLSVGMESKSHAGVAHLVSLHFVRSGRLDPEVSALLGYLEKDRVESDYNSAAVFNEAMARARIERAVAYGDAVRTILRGDGYL